MVDFVYVISISKLTQMVLLHGRHKKGHDSLLIDRLQLLLHVIFQRIRLMRWVLEKVNQWSNIEKNIMACKNWRQSLNPFEKYRMLVLKRSKKYLPRVNEKNKTSSHVSEKIYSKCKKKRILYKKNFMFSLENYWK